MSDMEVLQTVKDIDTAINVSLTSRDLKNVCPSIQSVI